ncbi:MAG: ribosome assembly RNA-binding protein YhbY [Gammaproteobacteria bacterium]|nr:ribosome assembly RNA-binding protein YhbY [Gammaproteobacteria bacterium]
MKLGNSQKQHLRGLGHHLKPVVMTGKSGLTTALFDELGVALAQHELIKVRVNAADRDARQKMIGELTEQSGSTLVQHVGHTILLYKKSPDKPKIQLPK